MNLNIVDKCKKEGEWTLDNRNDKYAKGLSRLIACETVSNENDRDKSKFYRFHDLLKEEFSHLFSVCEFESFDGSILLCWRGKTNDKPVMLMNHHDVVEATGRWSYSPFSGEIAEGKVWGRGTLDTKGGLFAMLTAANELAAEGFVPNRDVYFLSTCNEECTGDGANTISKVLEKRNIRFFMVLDEGGMILEEPIGGAKGKFAMVGLGEKGWVDIKFTARSNGGHASTPPKNSPLVRLGKFMAAVEKSKAFKTEISPTVHEMFSCLSTSMKGGLKLVLGNSRLFSPILKKVIPMISPVAGAMLKTTIAFTMANGSQGTNVLPEEAWVIGNMRYSHHQGENASVEAITEIAEKFDIETEVLSYGGDSPMSDYKSPAFELVKRAVDATFTDVKTSPYVMTGASDSRYLCRVCDNCLRFTPFLITQEQLDSIHGIDENIDVSALSPAVDFYRFIISEV